VHYGLWAADYGLWTVHCGLQTVLSKSRNELWDAHLESVQYGLDYVSGVGKCLQVSVHIVRKESVSTSLPVHDLHFHLTSLPESWVVLSVLQSWFEVLD